MRSNWKLSLGRLLSLFLMLAAGGVLVAQQENAKGAGGQKPAEQGKPVAGGEDLNVAAPVDPKSYKIGAEDVLNIRVWRENDLSGNVVVRPDGKITVPLAGEMEAAGLTPEQLTTRVGEALSKFLTKPEVIISVVSVMSKRYYLSGNVNRSGPTPLVTPTTILQALSAAGLGQWAKKGKIVVMRGTERIKFNYNDVIKGKHLEQNIYLQDGDHIFVP
ncbi:polysaccharide biosynthesis/export family protein [Paludibaculum fermentans]|uniref:Polysaccharide biosynthesis/export family protein n=1 Tax=Paludibaculum fermentans TaxID=1473598 RepID=A0A7S7NQF5_PALFE|nr:polysaccharide biosynthesis/export family protein [Paludibaculum fermentans]QOY87840.1 polysaccharide biosynthesis/export family protein [Paludibaculum fermentans]